MRKINFCLGFLCLVLLLSQPAAAEILQSTVQVPVNISAAVLAGDGAGFVTPENIYFICDPESPAHLICDIDGNTIHPPEFPFVDNGTTYYHAWVNFGFQNSIYAGKISAFSLTANLTAPAQGYVYYEWADGGGASGSQDLTFAAGTTQISLAAPPGQTVQSFFIGNLGNPSTNLSFTMSNLVLTVIQTPSVPPSIIGQNTTESPSCPFGSTINPDAGSLGEVIPLVGTPFSLYYVSERFRADSSFHPQTLGLGGWTPSIVHHYDAERSVFYAGNNERRNVVAQAFAGGGVYVTDLSGSEIYVFDSAGVHRTTRNSLTGAIIYNFSYDGTGRLTGIVDAFGNATQLTYVSGSLNIRSPYGQVTQLTFDANGYLARVTNPNNESHQLSHSATGLLLGFQKPGGQLSQFTYDTDGFLLTDLGAGGNTIELLRNFDVATSTQTVTMRTALNRQTLFSIAADDLTQATRSVQTANGSVSTSQSQPQGTDQSTDAFGGTLTNTKEQDPRFGWLAPFSRESSYVLPGSNINLSVSTQKNAQLSNASNPLSLTSLSTSTTLQGNRTYSSQYTQANRILLSQSPLGRTLATALNPKGQPISVRRGSLTQVNMSYDTRGRLTQVAQGNRNLRLTYDALGNLATSTDFLGKTTSYRYDNAGRVTRQIASNGQSILMSYDANGNLTSLTPPGRSAHNFGYNLFELLENYVPPSIGSAMSGANVYSYNLDRQLTEISRSDDGQINYNYGAANGLLESITSSDGGYNLQYYPNSSLVQTLSSPDSVNMSYEYFGNLPKRVISSGQVSSSVDYAYQSDGALASIGVNGSAIGLVYDRDGLLKSTGAMSYVRDNVGAITNNTLRQTAEEMKYDSFGTMIKRKLVEGRRTLLSEDIERDKLGRITKVDSTHKDRSFEYDSLGRLVYAHVGHDAREYQYDANGNRLAVVEGRNKTKGKYDVQDRLIEYGDTKYEYTDNGELKAKIITVEEIGDDAFCRFFKIKKKKDKRTEYDYDIFGNLQTVHFPDGKNIEYIYDGQNRRIGKRVNGHLVQSLAYQSQTQIAAELNAQGAITKRFIYGSKPNMPDYMVMNGKEYRIVSDQVGTPLILVDASNGKVVEEYLFDEFGRVIDEPRHGSMLPFGFAGGLADRDTDLVHFGARDYDPEVGRWTSKDPIGFAAGDSNLFGYVFSDPVNFIDPSGLIAEDYIASNYTTAEQFKIGLGFITAGTLGVGAGGLIIAKGPKTAPSALIAFASGLVGIGAIYEGILNLRKSADRSNVTFENALLDIHDSLIINAILPYLSPDERLSYQNKVAQACK